MQVVSHAYRILQYAARDPCGHRLQFVRTGTAVPATLHIEPQTLREYYCAATIGTLPPIQQYSAVPVLMM